MRFFSTVALIGFAAALKLSTEADLKNDSMALDIDREYSRGKRSGDLNDHKKDDEEDETTLAQLTRRNKGKI